jgi:hypothetical protein
MSVTDKNADSKLEIYFFFGLANISSNLMPFLSPPALDQVSSPFYGNFPLLTWVVVKKENNLQGKSIPGHLVNFRSLVAAGRCP